jgi:hypothetical protein
LQPLQEEVRYAHIAGRYVATNTEHLENPNAMAASQCAHHVELPAMMYAIPHGSACVVLTH